jgi:hypothetical protein
MDILWQQIVIAAAVCLSLLYLVYRYIRSRRQNRCCANCPTLKTLQNRPEVKAK